MTRSIRLGRFIGLTLAVGVALGCGSRRDGAWETTTPPDLVDETERTELLKAAEDAWAQRDDEGQIMAAIEKWQAAAELKPKDALTLTRLSRGLYYHADCFLRFDETQRDAYKARHDEGIVAAERALSAMSPAFATQMRDSGRIEEAVVMLNKNAVPALYWRSSNLGRWAAIDGFATLLSYKDEIRAVMQYCHDKDVEFFFKAPDRYFGVFYARTPGFAGGDMYQSERHFKKSILAHPNYFGTRILMAEEYAVKEGNRGMFNDLVEYVLNGNPDAVPEVAPENRCEQRKATRLREEADELF